MLALPPDHDRPRSGEDSCSAREGAQMIVFSRDHSRSLRDRAEMITVSIRRNRTIGRPLPGHGFPKPGGPQRTPEDTSLCRFGTVRPRVQIPGPRPTSCVRTSRRVFGHGACSFNSIHGEGAGDRADRAVFTTGSTAAATTTSWLEGSFKLGSSNGRGRPPVCTVTKQPTGYRAAWSMPTQDP